VLGIGQIDADLMAAGHCAIVHHDAFRPLENFFVNNLPHRRHCSAVELAIASLLPLFVPAEIANIFIKLPIINHI